MKQFNRAVSLLLALVLLLSMVPVMQIPTVSAATDEFGVENTGYIDLPVTVMDFMGDGYLFQSTGTWSSPFSITNLSNSEKGPDTITVTDDNGQSVTANFPGVKNKDNPNNNNGNNDAFRILGLAEEDMVKDSLVHTDATVTYIAYALKKSSWNPGNSVSNTYRYNTKFKSMVSSAMPLGSLEATYGKCDGGKGGDLPWYQVETAFDLAYYMLHYMWNPVPQDDLLYEDDFKGKTIPVHYNMIVDEIQKIRLYKKEENGQTLYVFDSAGAESIQNGTIYNHSGSANHPRSETTFMPVDGLGFCSGEYYGAGVTTNRDTLAQNFCFTIRAEGAFVYWEESDLYFEFGGDDDVYFYINDQLVCDIGGVHGRRIDGVHLNDLVANGTLDLEDGQICTFDMFYAERHTSGINMRLSTNIELMDYDLLTQKKQFDATTGAEYPNGQAVPYGTVIDYRFSILNRKHLPASEVRFTDENLGVELSKDRVKVSNATEYHSGANLSGERLEVLYIPCDDKGNLSTASPVTLGSYQELLNVIAPLTSDLVITEGVVPQIETPYRYVVQTADELMEILSMGVPGYCEFAVYGIERTLEKPGSAGGDRVILADGTGLYSNTLVSMANPGSLLDESNDVTVVYVTTVNGVSTCRIKGFDFGAVSSKTPLQLVADYGKPVEIPVASMRETISYDKKSFALEYVGFDIPEAGESGSKSGLVSQTLPKDLVLTEVGETEVPGEFGTFKRAKADAVCFTMTDFLESVETAYGVFSVTPLNDPDSGDQTTENEVLAYLYLEVRIIPANMMYYEAEDFTGTELSYTQKIETDALFFDFDGTGASLQQSSTIYGKTDWETVEYDDDGNARLSYWATTRDTELAKITHPILKIHDSAVYLETMTTTSGLYMAQIADYPKTNIPGGNTVEFRMKAKNLTAETLMGAVLLYSSGSASRTTKGVLASDGESYVFTVKPNTSKTILGLGIVLGTDIILEDVYVDYIYYGPADKTPSKLEAAGENVTANLSSGIIDEWELKTDGTAEETYQDFDPVGYRTYDMVVDRDNIPAEAFFADFDGKGYVDRYRTQPQYAGYDFDQYYTTDPVTGETTGKLYAKNWVINTVNGEYAEIDQKLGTLSFKLHNNISSIYVQSGTVFSGSTPGSLKLIPGAENVAQVRLKMENLTLKEGEDTPRIYLYYYDHDSTRDDKLQADWTTFPAEYLVTGEYYTATIPLSADKYGQEPMIDRIRIQLGNVVSTKDGRVTIDYIYVGPVSGMKQNIYDDYLYFTFDNTDADLLRYKGSQYGSTASASRNYDTTTYWHCGPSGNTRSITNDGYIVLTDKNTAQLYNFIHAGSNDDEAPFTYRLTGNDVYRIRFKITPNSGQTVEPDPGIDNKKPYLALEVAKNGVPAANFTLDLEKYADGEFHTLTIPINAPHLVTNNISVLNYIRTTFTYIKAATYTVDYIYVGPAALADEVTGTADYLFFDFTNNDAAKSRYSNPVYGTTGSNFDTGKWVTNTSTTGTPTYSSTGSTMSISPLAKTTMTTFPVILSQTTNDMSGPYPLAYKPTGNDYFKIRMKITGASDTDVKFMLRYSNVTSGGNSSTASSFDVTIPASALKSQDFFVLEGYINFGASKVVTSIRPEVYNLTVASGETITISYDYIYIGPPVEHKVTTDSLYFGFDNTDEDEARYANYAYGGYNFDDADTYGAYGIGQWATSNIVNGTSYDYTIDNEKGVLNIGVTNGFTGTAGTGSQKFGPYLVTTDRFGEYSVDENTKKLQYRPTNAHVAQLRFRVKDCQIVEGEKPCVVFLFGGYNAEGVYVDYNDLPVMRQKYDPVDGYITISIPLHQGFRDLAMVTNVGFRIQHIYSNDHSGVVELDYFYIGPGEGHPSTYGYDSSYNTASLYSNGVSLYTEGNGVRVDSNPNPAKYTETRFSFTGTGFDIISRTDPNQATIRVEIYTDPSYSKDYRLEGASVNLKGELDLYQIPVYSKHGLDHGTYYVSIMVNGEVNYPAIPALSRGNQFFLDAIRIYDPIDVTQGNAAAAGTDAAIAYGAYCADVEAHAIVKEVREILLSAETYNGITGMTDGAVFVDYATVPTVTTPTTSEGTGGENITDPDLVGKVENHITSDILTYDKIGPNNETYLGPQQLVAFQLLVFSDNIPNRLDVGAKAITEDLTMLNVKILDTGNGQDRAYTTTVQGSAQQYYSLYLESDTFKSKIIDGKKCYITTVIISNPWAKESVNEEKILSITDLRVGYMEPVVVSDPAIGTPTKRNTDMELPEDTFVPVRFVVTDELIDEVNAALAEMHKPCTHTPGQWETLCYAGVGQDGVEQLRCTQCGEILETKITEGYATLAFAGASVSLQSDLSINYKVNESFFTELGYRDPFVVVLDNGIETVIRDYTVTGGKLSFVYKNIAPHRIGDTVTATLYAYYNDTLYSSESRDYSIADYCYNMLGKYGNQKGYEALRTLLVDILHYGAKTQEYAKYRTDSLCNSRLTEEQLAWGTELTRELVNLRDQEYKVIESPEVQWKGAGLNLQESVAVRFCMVAESYEDLEIRITLNGITESYTAEDFDYKSNGTYVHFAKLNAALMSEPIYVAAYRNGKQVSNTICYSIESYAYAKQNDTTYPYLGELVERMICYGDSARAYIGK